MEFRNKNPGPLKKVYPTEENRSKCIDVVGGSHYDAFHGNDRDVSATHLRNANKEILNSFVSCDN